jgi:hypothetical protein
VPLLDPEGFPHPGITATLDNAARLRFGNPYVSVIIDGKIRSVQERAARRKWISLMRHRCVSTSKKPSVEGEEI